MTYPYLIPEIPQDYKTIENLKYISSSYGEDNKDQKTIDDAIKYGLINPESLKED